MNAPILIIHNQINTDAFRGLVGFLNENSGPVTIYLSSGGGDEHIMCCMISVMNSRIDDITLIGSGHLGSCAFNMFFLYWGKRELLKSVMGMCHLARVEVEMSEKGKMYYPQDYAMKQYITKFASETTLDVLRIIGATKKEIKKVMRGDEVYFLPDRIQELLDHSVAHYKQLQPPWIAEEEKQTQ